MKRFLFLFMMMALIGCDTNEGNPDYDNIKFFLHYKAYDHNPEKTDQFSFSHVRKSKVYYFFDGSFLFYLHTMEPDYCVCYVKKENVQKFRDALKELKQKYAEWKDIAEKNKVDKIVKKMDVEFPPVSFGWCKKKDIETHFNFSCCFRKNKTFYPRFVHDGNKSEIYLVDFFLLEDAIMNPQSIFAYFGFDNIKDIERFEYLVSDEGMEKIIKEKEEQEEEKRRKEEEIDNLFK